MKTDDLLHNWSLLEWRSFKGDGSRGRAGLHLRVRNEGVADNITEKVTSRSSPGGGACRGEKERKCDIPDKSRKPESPQHVQGTRAVLLVKRWWGEG